MTLLKTSKMVTASLIIQSYMNIHLGMLSWCQSDSPTPSIIRQKGLVRASSFEFASVLIRLVLELISSPEAVFW